MRPGDGAGAVVIDVLVVEDDFMVAKIHGGFVARTTGFRVAGVAHTGADALRAVRELAPDLVLLDIYLPDMNGLDVVRRLRQDVPDVDVLVVSAAKDAETVRRALHGGIVHYLMKPFGYDALRERLEHYSSTHRGLAKGGTAEQTDIDRIFGVGHQSDPPLPKGLSRETVRLVQRALEAAAGDMSAANCAAAAGISRVSARRYLEHFVASGQAGVRLRYGSAGRPERRYAWQAS